MASSMILAPEIWGERRHDRNILNLVSLSVRLHGVFCMHVILYRSAGFEIPIHSTLSIALLITSYSSAPLSCSNRVYSESAESFALCTESPSFTKLCCPEKVHLLVLPDTVTEPGDSGRVADDIAAAPLAPSLLHISRWSVFGNEESFIVQEGLALEEVISQLPAL